MNKLVSRSFLSIHQNRQTSNRLLRLTTPRVSSVVLNQPTTSSAGSNLGVFLNSSRQVRFRTRFLNYLDRVHLRMHSELDCVVCSSVLAWPGLSLSRIYLIPQFDPAVCPSSLISQAQFSPIRENILYYSRANRALTWVHPHFSSPSVL